MTVRDNMSFALKLAKRGSADIEQRVARAAGILGLAPVSRPVSAPALRRPAQRVAMGRAIVRDPQVFLFDEPLSNLDAMPRPDAHRDQGAAPAPEDDVGIYVTHDQIEAMTMADRIVVMRDGIVEQVGDPRSSTTHRRTRSSPRSSGRRR